MNANTKSQNEGAGSPAAVKAVGSLASQTQSAEALNEIGPTDPTGAVDPAMGRFGWGTPPMGGEE
jgi:hypothetical protein